MFTCLSSFAAYQVVTMHTNSLARAVVHTPVSNVVCRDDAILMNNPVLSCFKIVSLFTDLHVITWSFVFQLRALAVCTTRTANNLVWLFAGGIANIISRLMWSVYSKSCWFGQHDGVYSIYVRASVSSDPRSSSIIQSQQGDTPGREIYN